MKLVGRERRHLRIRKKIKGTHQRPRVVVFRSNKHIYAQLVNDEEQKVSTGCSTLSKEFKEKKIKSSTKEGAKEVGKILAKKLIDLGIKKISFDRAGFKYHGKVKALAEGLREGGIEF
ncbi:MAG: 50S ribosomal protein L18 [Candidatus Omnitrophota bacterium]|nr:MAG: 50S ribosomal protein L18 [Candidatus Omnitrophota bacterium]